MTDLYAYSTANRDDPEILHGIVFRLVDERERDGINRKIHELLGTKGFAENSASFCPKPGLIHLIDNEHLLHAHNRHATSAVNDTRQMPITLNDFLEIPELVNPRNIREFARSKHLARIVYSKELQSDMLVVVEEIRRRSVTFKTMYRAKK